MTADERGGAGGRLEAPDSIRLIQPEWLDAWREYAEGLEDTSLDFGDRETLMIHQDGFAGGWTAGQERIDALEADLAAALSREQAIVDCTTQKSVKGRHMIAEGKGRQFSAAIQAALDARRGQEGTVGGE